MNQMTRQPELKPAIPKARARLDPEMATSAPPAPTPALFELSALLLRLAEIAALVLSAFVIGELVLDYVSDERSRLYVNAVLTAAIFYAGLAEVTGVYDVDVRFSVRRAWGRVLTAWFATAMFMITMGFLFKASSDFSRRNNPMPPVSTSV